jgi:hypothetical protein
MMSRPGCKSSLSLAHSARRGVTLAQRKPETHERPLRHVEVDVDDLEQVELLLVHVGDRADGDGVDAALAVEDLDGAHDAHEGILHDAVRGRLAALLVDGRVDPLPHVNLAGPVLDRARDVGAVADAVHDFADEGELVDFDRVNREFRIALQTACYLDTCAEGGAYGWGW